MNMGRGDGCWRSQLPFWSLSQPCGIRGMGLHPLPAVSAAPADLVGLGLDSRQAYGDRHDARVKI